MCVPRCTKTFATTRCKPPNLYQRTLNGRRVSDAARREAELKIEGARNIILKLGKPFPRRVPTMPSKAIAVRRDTRSRLLDSLKRSGEDQTQPLPRTTRKQPKKKTKSRTSATPQYLCPHDHRHQYHNHYPEVLTIEGLCRAHSVSKH